MRTSRRRESRRRLAALPGVMLAPLIDAVLILLIFFMLVSRYLQPTIDLTLPESRAAAAEARTSVTITLTAAGELYFEGQSVDAQQLTAKLEEVDPSQVESVLLRADERVPLKLVVGVLDIVRASSLESVALEVRRK